MIASGSFELIAVVGATASGKSALAVKLAKDFNGEVINLDSVQVFRELDIGSGKVTKSEMGGITHHLIDILEPNEPLDVNDMVKRADHAISQIKARGKLPIVVAGTSLYLKCLLGGLIDVPSEDKNFRDSLASIETQVLYKKLKEVDPSRAADLAPADRMRIIRSLEIYQLTGSTHSKIIQEHKHKEDRYRALLLHLAWTREDLYRRIEKRCERMVEQGLLVEARAIFDRYGKVAALASLGYAQALEVILGRESSDSLVTKIQTKTRQFAKRQLTFWRNSPLTMGWIVYPREDGEVLKSKEKPLKKGAALLDFIVYKWTYHELMANIRAAMSSVKIGTELWHLSAKELE